jgi:hypothetical protein
MTAIQLGSEAYQRDADSNIVESKLFDNYGPCVKLQEALAHN